MPSQFLLEWYEINLLLTLEVLVAFLMRMHMEFDWLKLDPGPWGVIWSSIFSECPACWILAEINFGKLVFILETFFFLSVSLVIWNINKLIYFSSFYLFHVWEMLLKGWLREPFVSLIITLHSQLFWIFHYLGYLFGFSLLHLEFVFFWKIWRV